MIPVEYQPKHRGKAPAIVVGNGTEIERSRAEHVLGLPCPHHTPRWYAESRAKHRAVAS